MAPPAPPSADLVFASLPLAVIAYGATLGIPHAELVVTSGLDPEDLRDPDALVDYESLIRLWDLLLARFPDRPLGIDYASYLSPHTLGVLGYALTHCQQLGDALKLYARHCRLADPRLTVTIERSASQARVAFVHEPRVEAMAEPMEMMLAAETFATRRLNPGSPPPTEVCFRHSRRHPTGRYAEVFAAPVRFDAEWTGVCFASDALSLPILGADGEVVRRPHYGVRAHRAMVPRGGKAGQHRRGGGREHQGEQRNSNGPEDICLGNQEGHHL